MATTTLGPCSAGASCQAVGTGHFTYWAPKYYERDGRNRTGTVTVMQIINTVANTTRFSTITKGLPRDFTPPPTNAAGTQTAKVTYLHHGTNLTTTVAYPTPFLNLPDEYTVLGDYSLPQPSGPVQCVHNANRTVSIPTNFQPRWKFNDAKWNVSEYYDPEDPLGWSFSYHTTTNWTHTGAMDELIDVLPDDVPDLPHDVVRGCQPDNPPQPYAIGYNPNWRVVGSTMVVYEGEPAGKTAEGNPGGQLPSAPAQVPAGAGAVVTGAGTGTGAGAGVAGGAVGAGAGGGVGLGAPGSAGTTAAGRIGNAPTGESGINSGLAGATKTGSGSVAKPGVVASLASGGGLGSASAAVLCSVVTVFVLMAM